MSVYTIQKRIIEPNDFISYINSVAFLSGTGITLKSIKSCGSNYNDLYFSSLLDDTQLNSLITEVDNYVNPYIMIDYLSISNDIVEFSDLSWKEIKEFSYPGSKLSIYNDICFSSCIISGTGNYNIRLWDCTNQLLMCEINNYNNTVSERIHSDITNMPEDAAIFCVQCYVDNSDTIARISNIELKRIIY